MRTFLFCSFLVLSAFIVPGMCGAQGDIQVHPGCPLCGMDRHAYAHSRMLLQYDDGSSLGTCSIHCAAMELAVNRQKTLTKLYAADYVTKKLIDARHAFWVIGGKRPGVMTSRAKWAFEKRSDAEDFMRQQGGELGVYEDAMSATFRDMYDDIKLIRKRRERRAAALQDVKDHPECKYCGMNRELYAFSRMLITYNSGPATATCSIHCSAMDLALNVEKTPGAMLVGDFHTKRLIDAEKALWVIGGKKTGVMSIKGKWAFENRADADAFIGENGGSMGSFDEALKTTFEDM